MPRCHSRVLSSTLACVVGLLTAVSAGAQSRNAIATEVYRTDFEAGMGAIAVVSSSVTLTEDPAEVIGGSRSLKLSGPGAAIYLHPSVVPLQVSKVYIVEYRYRVLASDAPWALGVGFSLTGPDGTAHYIPLRGPVAAAGATGIDSRSARAGGPNDTFVFHTWNGAVVIDDIRILRHDVQSAAPAAPRITYGFPRLANYALLAPDTIAFLNNVSQHEVEQVASRYDLLVGSSFDHTLGAAAWVRRLKSLNSTLRILPYKQAFMAQFDGGIDSSGLLQSFNTGLHPSWFMRRPTGEVLSEPAFPQNVQLNHTPFSEAVNGLTVNTYTADFLADQVLTSGLWAGIHFDQPEWYINPLLGEPPPSIDLNRDGVAEPVGAVQHAWALGFFDYFTTMARRLGSGTLLYGNAGHIPGNPMVLPMLNGWQGEVVSPYAIAPGGEWLTDAPSKWYRLVENYRLATTYARAPQLVSLQFTGRELGEQTGGLTPNGYPQRTPQIEWRDYRRMRLGLTTALLGNGFFEYDLVDNTTAPVWFDEFAVDASGAATTAMSGKGYLGQPLGEGYELPYTSATVFRLDFESANVPNGVAVGPGTISSNPAHVISGNSSFVVSQSDIAESKWLFYSALPLIPGRSYQLLADYRILDYRPTTYAGLLGIGFRDALGQLPPERSASLFLPDTAGPGQQGTLRAAIKASNGAATMVGGLTDTGSVAIDNVRLLEATGGVWRRDFENGIVLVNPTPEPLYVSQYEIAGPRNRTSIRRIRGTQVPTWNDGAPVTAGIWLGSGDGIVLLAARDAATLPPAVETVTATPSDSGAALVWPGVAGYGAGYIVRYGESAQHLTRSAAAGPTSWLQLADLMPGTTYAATIAAHDFLGREGPAAAFAFTTTGSAVNRPTFVLSAQTPGLAPGSVAILEGSGLSDAVLTETGPAFPLTLGSTVVSVNGVTAALLSVAPGRVSFLVPWDVVGTDAVIGVSRSGVSAPERRAPIVTSRPWIFTWPAGDVAIATHSNGAVVSAAVPAVPGHTIDILAAGLGGVLPFPDNGSAAGGIHAAAVTSEITVTVSGVPATVHGAWLLPGSAASYGIRITIPAGVPGGLHTLNVSVGGSSANATRIPVQ